ncbi:MAG: hypothetical protein KGL39_43900 [Patescibacteria group bacterium]|nr:hypothetical protein [Patescibacteria group bacterium]
MWDYSALQPDGAWSPTMNSASGIGGPLGGIMNLLKSRSSQTGTPNAPASVSSQGTGMGSRIGLGNTTLGYKAPGGEGANVWFPGGTPNFGPVQGRWTGGPGGDLMQAPGSSAPNNSLAVGGPWQTGNPAGWFNGQGQGFTFFGQGTPTQVGTNEFVWSNPQVPGSNATQNGSAGSVGSNTNSLQNLMQLVSSLQNNYNSLQGQYNSLNTNYGNLQGQYNSLNQQIQPLQQSYQQAQQQNWNNYGAGA